MEQDVYRIIGKSLVRYAGVRCTPALRRTLRGLAFCGALAMSASANALDVNEMSAVMDRREILARFTQTSENDLRSLALWCARASNAGLLGFGEIIFCSTTWEFLKEHYFGRDSDALLRWYQSHRDDPIEAAR